MKASEIINQVANSEEYRSICLKIARGKEYSEDLFHEIILILCEYKPEKIEELYRNNQLKYFVVQLFKNQHNNPKNSFYKNYRKQEVEFNQNFLDHEDEDEQDHIEENRIIEAILNEMQTEGLTQDEWYERTLFQEYLKAGSCAKLEKKTGIGRKSIAATIFNLKVKIRMRHGI